MSRAILPMLALLALAAAAPAEQIKQPLRDTDVVARVNGTTIYRKAVRELVQGILAAQDRAPDPASVEKLAGSALDSLIALDLLYQESQARGVQVNDAAVDEELAHNRKRFPDARAFEAAMKSSGISQADLRRDTLKTMAVNRLLEGSIWKDLHITPEQAKDFYEHNREEFRHPAEVRASHILIRVPEQASATERASAKQRAAALLDKLKAGADFADVARTGSEDPVTAAQGGDMGYLAKGDMDSAFEKAAFALGSGHLSGVVNTPYGYHIIKVTERREAGHRPLSEVQERIIQVLLQSERQQRQTDLVTQLRSQAKIEYLDRSDR